MALEIRHNPFENAHENEAFRRLANQLNEFFIKKEWDGLLIGNPYCEQDERIKPDVLLYTPNSFIIIDLKDYEGTIVLPSENHFKTEQWRLKEDGKVIMGGSYLNPFLQLSSYRNKIKYLFSAILDKNQHLGNYVNPGHTQLLALFSGPVNIINPVSGQYNRYFNITFEDKLPDYLVDRTSQISFSEVFADEVKILFNADPYVLKETTEIIQLEKGKNRPDFRENQARILPDIDEFVEKGEKRILLIDGPEQSGKTFLIDYIKEKAFANGVLQTDTLTFSARVARYLTAKTNHHFQGVFGFIYGGQAVHPENDKKEDEEFETINEEDTLKDIIPLRTNSIIETNALIIVDEAHLINNSLRQSELLQFGTGHLLDDLIKYCALNDSNRKIVFIGDSCQLTFGNDNESALCLEYYKSKECEDIVTSLKLSYDHYIEASPKVVENLKIVDQIHHNLYNKLNIKANTEIKHLASVEAAVKLTEGLKNEDYVKKTPRIVFLAYKNSTVLETNNWIKKKILNKSANLEKGDLLIINNSIVIPRKNPFEKPKQIGSGSFLVVNEIKEEHKETITTKKMAPVILTLRKINVSITGMEGDADLWFLDNYFYSTSSELPKEEAIALQIYKNRRINQKLKELGLEDEFQKSLIISDEYKTAKIELDSYEDELLNGDRVRTKVKQVEAKLRKIEKKKRREHFQKQRYEIIMEDPILQIAFVRYGWAITVHKSIGQKWETVFFNTDMGDNHGRTNKDYFQWLYTGIARAEHNLNLINFEPITPIDGIYLAPSNDECLLDTKMPNLKKLNLDLEKAEEEFINEHLPLIEHKEVQDYAFTICKRLGDKGYELVDITHSNWQIRVRLKKQTNNVGLIFFFNGNGNVKEANPDKVQDKKLQLELENVLKQIIKSEPILPNDYRNSIYNFWIAKFNDRGFEIKSLECFDYKDRATIVKDSKWLVIEINYDGKGFIKSVKPFKANDKGMWAAINDIFKYYE